MRLKSVGNREKKLPEYQVDFFGLPNLNGRSRFVSEILTSNLEDVCSVIQAAVAKKKTFKTASVFFEFPKIIEFYTVCVFNTSRIYSIDPGTRSVCLRKKFIEENLTLKILGCFLCPKRIKT